MAPADLAAFFASCGACAMRAGDTPLIDAARHGRAADVVALLFADVNEPKTDGSGFSALFIACQKGHSEVVAADRTPT